MGVVPAPTAPPATRGTPMTATTKRTKKIALASLAAAFALALGACSPEVGSDEWCEDMKEKGKGDWTANEAADFAKHCVL